jgi:hypothetical protein
MWDDALDLDVVDQEELRRVLSRISTDAVSPLRPDHNACCLIPVNALH